jgi:mannose-1-phosphate guanylyltransferase/phosphomannomutase
MLPLANRPMMEHIVHLLRSHGIDEIVVTVAFLANQIRTYFGDGSEFGVRMVYATETSPSAPPARCATPWTSSTSASW